MAKRSFTNMTYTPTATADNASLTTLTYQAIGASTAAAGLMIHEVYIGGQAGASTPTFMCLRRDSTLGATLTALASPNSDGPMNTLTAAAQVGSLTFITATTHPIPTNVTTSAKLNLSLNAFGGIVRWVAAPDEQWWIIGVTVSISETSLSAATGGTPGLLGSHIIYEAF